MESATGILIVVGMLVIAVFPMLWNQLRMEKKHIEIAGSVVNYDVFFREFWYFSKKNVPELLNILAVPGTYEYYEYCFDRENMLLSLTNVLSRDTTKYIVILKSECEGTRIRLYRKEGLHRSNKVGIEVVFFENIFCKNVLDASPIPYSKRDE